VTGVKKGFTTHYAGSRNNADRQVFRLGFLKRHITTFSKKRKSLDSSMGLSAGQLVNVINRHGDAFVRESHPLPYSPVSLSRSDHAFRMRKQKRDSARIQAPVSSSIFNCKRMLPQDPDICKYKHKCYNIAVCKVHHSRLL